MQRNMSIRVVFLGTSAAVPTLQRSLPAVVLQRGTELLMFDCGEGVQRQMMRVKVGFHKDMKIFISHLHGDHVLGLPGLLQTMALLNRQKKLAVYGPRGIARFIEDIQETLQFGLTFAVELHEINDGGMICDEAEYVVEAVRSNHMTESLCYALVEKPRPGKFFPEKAKALEIPEGIMWSKLQHGVQVNFGGKIVKPEDVADTPRKGRKIVYSGDTRPFKEFAEFAANADLVIHEATLDDSLAQKATEDGHSTPSQAAENAKNAKAKQLVLTHISARYANTTLLLEQAKKTFENTLVAEDFLILELPLP